LDLEQLRSSGASLHRKLFLRMLSNAAGLPPDQLVFHDYGLPDNVAFRLADGLPEDPDLMRSCAAFRYWKVFLLAPVPFVRDGIRMEDERTNISWPLSCRGSTSPWATLPFQYRSRVSTIVVSRSCL
jgi:hypothetical protein